MKIKEDVANVLANSRVEKNKLYLPDVQLERKLYTDINKVLIAIKGKWNRNAKAHIFPENPEQTIENILQTGEYIDDKKEFQFFETPVSLAEKLVEMAKIQEGETVLEPSAGKGRISSMIENVHCIELNLSNRHYLRSQNQIVIHDDFMSFSPEDDYHVIIANPPFSKQQDIDHVNKMMDIAKRRVVSIMSASVLWRDNKKTVAFRKRIEDLGGTFEMLPDDSFKESGTKVKTCVVCVDM